ncbi:hypothetical protein C8J57DRAFT_1223107 [Mycena rebaudengoi]|nr:hypothetical protein C8J57DRAFT_1223107 [Mycena rebaudengoi]
MLKIWNCGLEVQTGKKCIMAGGRSGRMAPSHKSGCRVGFGPRRGWIFHKAHGNFFERRTGLCFKPELDLRSPETNTIGVEKMSDVKNDRRKSCQKGAEQNYLENIWVMDTPEDNVSITSFQCSVRLSFHHHSFRNVPANPVAVIDGDGECPAILQPLLFCPDCGILSRDNFIQATSLESANFSFAGLNLISHRAISSAAIRFLDNHADACPFARCLHVTQAVLLDGGGRSHLPNCKASWPLGLVNFGPACVHTQIQAQARTSPFARAQARFAESVVPGSSGGGTQPRYGTRTANKP